MKIPKPLRATVELWMAQDALSKIVILFSILLVSFAYLPSLKRSHFCFVFPDLALGFLPPKRHETNQI